MQLAHPTFFFRYRIERCLGRGGMGEVYEAFDTRLRRAVALKILTTVADASQAELRRLLVEARSLAALQHRNIVTVYDVGEHGNVPYLTMELLRGRSLAAIAKAGDGTRSERVRWLVEMASALATVHRAGLVHRDVKPGNVMIADDGRAVLFDFGIARPADPNVGTFDGQSVRGGMMIGTPRYMAPEITTGARASAAADQYGWGVIAAQLLTGERPYAEWDIARALENAAIAKDLRAIVLRATDRAPQNRFASMDEILAALEPALREPARPRRRLVPIIAVASASIVVGAIGGALLMRSARAHQEAPSATTSAMPLVPLSSDPLPAPSASTAPSASGAPSATVVTPAHRLVSSAPTRECSADADCACGVSKASGMCAVGPVTRIDTSRQCPDYCLGFDGNLTTACRAGRCVNVRATPE
ncbi:MAG TPA: protein kinase [Polyangiaceae bacterium]